MAPSSRPRWRSSQPLRQPREDGGYRKDGPVWVAKLELGEGDEPEQREARALRKRQVNDVTDQLLARLAEESTA
jgi:hypothetical protein